MANDSTLSNLKFIGYYHGHTCYTYTIRTHVTQDRDYIKKIVLLKLYMENISSKKDNNCEILH